MLDRSILALLEQRGALAYEQVAAHLQERPDIVRNALTDLRNRGLVDVLSVGELEGHTTRAASYWRLTDAGRDELASRRSE
jgi:predicted ArsR family transcriptional regulator